MKKLLAIIISIILIFSIAACGTSAASGSKEDKKNTLDVGNKLAENQPTPTDIDYSLERYNLIRRTYWVNGQREKANALVCEIEKPLGYIVLFGEAGTVIGSFVVDGKVSSLNSFLTPDSEHYEQISSSDDSDWFVSDNSWLPDVDGSYGENDNGIFFFTPDGKYIEWTGIYLYSDIPFIVDNPVLKVGTENE